VLIPCQLGVSGINWCPFKGDGLNIVLLGVAEMKQKTHSGAKKRFRVLSSGKIKRKKKNLRHLLGSKNKKRKRHLRAKTYVASVNTRQIRQLMVY